MEDGRLQAINYKKSRDDLNPYLGTYCFSPFEKEEDQQVYHHFCLKCGIHLFLTGRFSAFHSRRNAKFLIRSRIRISRLPWWPCLQCQFAYFESQGAWQRYQRLHCAGQSTICRGAWSDLGNPQGRALSWRCLVTIRHSSMRF